MAQHLVVEKPFKALAEQFFTAADPLPAGVCLLVHIEGVPVVPHVHCVDGVRDCHDTDWILASKYVEDTFLDVITDTEFQDRFGPGGLGV